MVHVLHFTKNFRVLQSFLKCNEKKFYPLSILRLVGLPTTGLFSCSCDTSQKYGKPVQSLRFVHKKWRSPTKQTCIIKLEFILVIRYDFLIYIEVKKGIRYSKLVHRHVIVHSMYSRSFSRYWTIQ